MENKNSPDYGNWVSRKLINKCLLFFALFAVVTITIFAAAPAGEAWLIIKALFIILALFFLAGLIYFTIARKLFSPEGGNIQDKILELVISHIRWDGEGQALDIGCGSGALTIKLAQRFANAKVTGIDYWGGSWEYSQKQCEENSRMEGVADRTDFWHASASKLPFKNESFDLVVSNLTFHEVRDIDNKMDALVEALRVLKRGGTFVFQDLFLIERYYGKKEELLEALRKEGVAEVIFVDTSGSDFIPRALKLPFMVGTIALIHGQK